MDGFKMSDSDDKPFECTAPGCGQRFANNDHLERHKQKHQLTLKFGSLKGSDLSVADQTPTPTRFFRNCEEEGLFQDLDNPFDQDFKRAAVPVQASNSSNSHPTTQLSSGQNSLPSSATPSQNIVVIDDSESKVLLAPPPLAPSQITSTTAAGAEENKKSVIITAPVSVLVRVPPHIPPAIPASIAAPDAQVPSALPVPSHIGNSRTNSASSAMPIPSIPTPAIVTSPNASSPPSFAGSAKQRLKEQLKLHQQANPSNIIHRAMTEAVDMVTQQNGILSPGNHMNHSHHPTTIVPNTNVSSQDTKRGPAAGKRPRRTQDELDPDERRKRFLERNRAAATRCREKRKIWVQQLEKKADDLTTTNAHLQSEITLLRTEVAQLKSLLLAHKDCPVTIAQQRNSQLLNHQVGEQTNGVITANSHGEPATAEDVATSALTQMAHRATLELENLAATTISSVSNAQGVITTNSNPIGV